MPSGRFRWCSAPRAPASGSHQNSWTQFFPDNGSDERFTASECECDDGVCDPGAINAELALAGGVAGYEDP